MMKIIEDAPSDRFRDAWRVAGNHILAQADGGINWLRTDLNSPLIEHLSFRIGNQLFFVFVEAEEFNFDNYKDLFISTANNASAIPCIMPMTERLTGYETSVSGWGLVHAESGKIINPLDLVSDELMLMSDFELHDFAIQVVKDSLTKEGKTVVYMQSSDMDPSVWFEEDGNRSWVVVRAVRYPQKDVITITSDDINADVSGLDGKGYCAFVSVANADDPFDPAASDNGNYLPLYRGHGMIVSYKGLTEM